MKNVFNLDKNWNFLMGDGEPYPLLTHGEAYGNCKAGGVLGIPSPSYDDSGWRVLDVPHDFLTETPYDKDTLISYAYRKRCNAWYRKHFRLPENCKGKHLLLCFDGIAVRADVYLNGSLVGRSDSAYAPLEIDISDRAYFGDRENVLAVFCDGITTEGWWYEGAGIYRHVTLYVKENIHVTRDGFFIKPVKCDDGSWNVMFEAEAENTSYSDTEVYASFGIDGFEGNNTVSSEKILLRAGESAKLCAAIKVENPELWDVGNPYLYKAEVKLYAGDCISDTENDDFGFRTFTVDCDKGFFLNGKQIKLKGVCCHQDHAGVGAAVPDSVAQYRIHRIKELGANAYRCAHGMPARAILRACDREGILVMDENRRFETRREVISHLISMVKQARNHPSVVLYSLFNEEPLQGTEEGANIYRRLRTAVLRTDDSRLLTGAMNGGILNPEGAALLLDVTGINYDVEYGCPEFHRRFPKHPAFGSENNCALSTRGCYKTDYSAHRTSCYDEDYAAWGQRIKTTWGFARENEWYGGIFIWSGFDYAGEPTPFGWPSISTQFGIMDTCGFPKDSFWQNRACFTDEPVLHILPHWNWSEGEQVRVMTAANCDEVELFLNGRSLGRKPSDVCSPAEWNVTFEAGVLSCIGYRNGEAVITAENRTSDAPAEILIEPYRNEVYDDGEDAVCVNLSVTDSDGIVCETDDRNMHITVNGDGALLGVGNGNPNEQIPFHGSDVTLFAGHAQCVIGIKPNARKLSLSVSCGGLPVGEYCFDIKHKDIPDYI